MARWKATVSYGKITISGNANESFWISTEGSNNALTFAVGMSSPRPCRVIEAEMGMIPRISQSSVTTRDPEKRRTRMHVNKVV